MQRTEHFKKSTEQWLGKLFAVDTESEAEDFDPPEDEDGRKATSADELSPSDNDLQMMKNQTWAKNVAGVNAFLGNL